MEKELKACPFCGRIPKTSQRPESEASGGGHVAFVVCYCGGYASTAHQMGHAETVQAAIAEVVEKWNTRAQLPSRGGEAVAWQAGFIESGDAWDAWQTCSKEHHDFVKRCPNEWPDYEVRALYTHPADQVAEPDAELVELLDWLRRSINCTPENDVDKCGAWISTKHPMIQRIDAKMASLK